MSKTVNLTEEQKKLLTDAIEASNQATTQAQMAVELANVRRRSLDDMITMFCSCSGLTKEKVKIDPVAGTVTEE